MLALALSAPSSIFRISDRYSKVTNRILMCVKRNSRLLFRKSRFLFQLFRLLTRLTAPVRRRTYRLRSVDSRAAMSCALWRRIPSARNQAQGYLYRSRGDAYDLLIQPGPVLTPPIAFTRRGGSPTPHSGDDDFGGWATRRLEAQPPQPAAPSPTPPPLARLRSVLEPVCWKQKSKPFVGVSDANNRKS